MSNHIFVTVYKNGERGEPDRPLFVSPAEASFELALSVDDQNTATFAVNGRAEYTTILEPLMNRLALLAWADGADFQIHVHDFQATVAAVVASKRRGNWADR